MRRPKSTDGGVARRRLILDAARDCFLRFGYAKTSLEDIAKQAAISRPLIYLQFKGKEEIFEAVLTDIFATTYRRAQQALAKSGSKQDRLLAVYEALLLDPWNELIANAPMGAEFYEACRRATPEIQAKHTRIQLKYTQAILADKETSEVFILAVDGLIQDLPNPKVLRRRLEVLVDRFTEG